MVSGPVWLTENPDPEFEDWIVNGYKFQAKSVKDVLAVVAQFIKVSAYRKADIEAHRELREKYGDRLKMTISGDMWLDCMATGVNKGEAVKLGESQTPATASQLLLINAGCHSPATYHRWSSLNGHRTFRAAAWCVFNIYPVWIP